MRYLCLLLVLLFLPSGLFTAAAESADDRLSAALEALGVVSISFEGEFPGITASAAPSLSAEGIREAIRQEHGSWWGNSPYWRSVSARSAVRPPALYVLQIV